MTSRFLPSRNAQEPVKKINEVLWIRILSYVSGFRLDDPDSVLRIWIPCSGSGFRVADLDSVLQIRIPCNGSGFLVVDMDTLFRIRIPCFRGSPDFGRRTIKTGSGSVQFENTNSDPLKMILYITVIKLSFFSPMH